MKSSNWSDDSKKIRGVRSGMVEKVEYSAPTRNILISFLSGANSGGNSGFSDLLGEGENSPRHLYLVLGDQELAAIFASLDSDVQERIVDMASASKELTA